MNWRVALITVGILFCCETGSAVAGGYPIGIRRKSHKPCGAVERVKVHLKCRLAGVERVLPKVCYKYTSNADLVDLLRVAKRWGTREGNRGRDEAIGWAEKYCERKDASITAEKRTYSVQDVEKLLDGQNWKSWTALVVSLILLVATIMSHVNNSRLRDRVLDLEGRIGSLVSKDIEAE